MEGKWQNGGAKIKVKAAAATTPLYIPDGTILPLARVGPEENAFHSHKIDFHIFLSGPAKASTRYVFDDGATFAYQKGGYSEVEITARRKGPTLEIKLATLRDGFGPGEFTFTTTPEISRVRVNGVVARKCAGQGVPLGPGKTQTWVI
jgi:hypothetical protein